jgi:hypothetical protein
VDGVAREVESLELLVRLQVVLSHFAQVTALELNHRDVAEEIGESVREKIDGSVRDENSVDVGVGLVVLVVLDDLRDSRVGMGDFERGLDVADVDGAEVEPVVGLVVALDGEGCRWRCCECDDYGDCGNEAEIVLKNIINIFMKKYFKKIFKIVF